MQRLHRSLLRLGVDSKILVLRDEGFGPDVSRLPRVETLSLERRIRAITGRLGLNDIHRLGSFQLDKHTFYQNADLVHFHCLHSGTFSYLALPKVAAAKPVVHTLHDTWAFTGHCGYSYDCQRWKTGCGDCPYPEENPAIARDATRLEWRMKTRAFIKADVQLISKCGWTTRMSKVSALRHLPLAEIPYGVDTRVYRPRGRARSRELLGLPADRFVLLFSAQNLANRRKGSDLLIRALKGLPADMAARTILLTMGKRGARIGPGYRAACSRPGLSGRRSLQVDRLLRRRSLPVSDPGRRLRTRRRSRARPAELRSFRFASGASRITFDPGRPAFSPSRKTHSAFATESLFSCRTKRVVFECPVPAETPCSGTTTSAWRPRATPTCTRRCCPAAGHLSGTRSRRSCLRIQDTMTRAISRERRPADPGAGERLPVARVLEAD